MRQWRLIPFRFPDNYAVLRRLRDLFFLTRGLSLNCSGRLFPKRLGRRRLLGFAFALPLGSKLSITSRTLGVRRRLHSRYQFTQRVKISHQHTHSSLESPVH